jgi:hypothetical protein
MTLENPVEGRVIAGDNQTLIAIDSCLVGILDTKVELLGSAHEMLSNLE